MSGRATHRDERRRERVPPIVGHGAAGGQCSLRTSRGRARRWPPSVRWLGFAESSTGSFGRLRLIDRPERRTLRCSGRTRWFELRKTLSQPARWRPLLDSSVRLRVWRFDRWSLAASLTAEASACAERLRHAASSPELGWGDAQRAVASRFRDRLSRRERRRRRRGASVTRVAMTGSVTTPS